MLSAMPFEVHHGTIAALGFRFGKTAYTPDLNGIPEEAHPISRAWTCGLWMP